MVKAETRTELIGLRLTKEERAGLERLREALSMESQQDAIRCLLDFAEDFILNPKDSLQLQLDLDKLGHTPEGYHRFAEYLEAHPERFPWLRERIIRKARLKY